MSGFNCLIICLPNKSKLKHDLQLRNLTKNSENTQSPQTQNIKINNTFPSYLFTKSHSGNVTPRNPKSPPKSRKSNLSANPEIPNRIQIVNNISRLSLSSHGSGTVLNKQMDTDFTDMQANFLMLKEHESKHSQIQRKQILSTLVEGKLPQHIINRYGKERFSVKTAFEMRPSNSSEAYRISNKSTPVVRVKRSNGPKVSSGLNCEIRTITEKEENQNLSGSYLIFGKDKVEERFQNMDQKFQDINMNQSNVDRGFGNMQNTFGQIQANASLQNSLVENRKNAGFRGIKSRVYF